MNWKWKTKKGLIQILKPDSEHLVREYPNRLAVWRKDGERLTWEELQIVKELVWGDIVAVEVYPCNNDVINIKHTRHLWSSKEIRETVKLVCHHPEFDKEEI